MKKPRAHKIDTAQGSINSFSRTGFVDPPATIKEGDSRLMGYWTTYTADRTAEDWDQKQLDDVARLCFLMVEWWDLTADIQENGYTATSNTGVEKTRPEVDARAKAFSASWTIIRGLGFNERKDHGTLKNRKAAADAALAKKKQFETSSLIAS